MKVYFALLAICKILSCNIEKKEKEPSIEGRYTAFQEGEFSKAWDTIIIKSYDSKTNTFIIEHYTGYHRIRKGLLQPKEYKEDKSVGVMDTEQGQLVEQKKGRVYTFFSASDELILGSSRYKKLR